MSKLQTFLGVEPDHFYRLQHKNKFLCSNMVTSARCKKNNFYLDMMTAFKFQFMLQRKLEIQLLDP